MTVDGRGAAVDRRATREARARHATDTVVATAREYGVTVTDPVVVNDVFSLMVHLRPAPVIARVATVMPRLRSPITEWLQREVDVTGYLSKRGAPVVGPSPELPAGPHERNGISFSFWTHVEADPDRDVSAADCASMLVDLHAELASYPSSLPRFIGDDIQQGLGWLDRVGDLLSDEERERLRDCAARVDPLIHGAADDWQPLHGDAHPGNILPTRDGLQWIDFEDVCLGPVEWDLATVGSVDAVRRARHLDAERLAACADLRSLQVALALITFDDELGDLDGWRPGLRSVLDSIPGETGR